MPKTVLIVEDNIVHANLIKDLLEVKGINAVHVANGGEALAMARDCRPDLIIMDVQLPGISGLEVTEAIKADETLKNIPIIAVTAFASKRDEQRMREAGCTDFITKPFRVPDFLEIIEKLLR